MQSKELKDFYEKTLGIDAKKKRKERRIRLKRVFNYDAEMKFIKSFWQLKKKDMTLDEFAVLAKKTLVDTEQLSEAILEFFLEEERMKIKIEELEKKKEEYDKKLSEIKNEIKDLKDILKEEDDDMKSFDSLGVPLSSIKKLSNSRVGISSRPIILVIYKKITSMVKKKFTSI